MATRIIQVKGAKDVAPAAAEGAKALRKGLLVGFPTETVYGIAAVATRGEAMDRLRELKSRPSRPFSVHLGRPADVHRYIKDLPDAAGRLIHRAWPGPVTILAPTGGRLADPKLRRRNGLHELLCHDGFIGLRCPDEPVAAAMLAAVSLPVVAPSANLAGKPSPRSAEDVLADLDGRIDLLLDAGETRFGRDSTIVRCQAGRWEVLREGVYDAGAIGRMIRRRLLIVCTGNTCRSAMAEGLARRVLAERLGCEVGELGDRGIEVLSAGVFAADGPPASRDAVAAAADMGVDISAHRSRKLTRELIKRADLVLCMTASHVADVTGLAPGSSPKVRRLDDGGDVPDPIGQGHEVYRRAAGRIDRALRVALREGLP